MGAQMSVQVSNEPLGNPTEVLLLRKLACWAEVFFEYSRNLKETAVLSESLSKDLS